jgi:hypothetical protein
MSPATGTLPLIPRFWLMATSVLADGLDSAPLSGASCPRAVAVRDSPPVHDVSLVGPC